MRFTAIILLIPLFFACKHKTDTAKEQNLNLEQISGAGRRNVIFILSDDHRYDFMGFTGKTPGLQTPNLDRLVREGAHMQNAFVSTALCSPSRASILTGLYAHTHTVIDNQAPSPVDLVYFPQYLQSQGYQTAFIGKWHMGGGQDEPRPGFNHWVSFKGQGTYYSPELNVDGVRKIFDSTTYITDLLTDYSVDWLAKQSKDGQPFFLYLSHKAVHSEFEPAQRHTDQYRDIEIQYPASMYLTAPDSTLPENLPRSLVIPKENRSVNGAGTVNFRGIPEWVKKQRYSWHGVDHMYHGQIEFDDFYRRYLETLSGVDESVGRVLAFLEKAGLDKNTMVIYMGDNGFSFGEHGLIDKRHMYEESMRVPLIARCPEIIRPDTKISKMIMNIDIAPTVLELAGLKAPEHMDGKSFLPLLQEKEIPWRDKVFYEYYWEYDFPQTPTMHGVRTDRYKYIRYHGLWDANEFYDLQEDPNEMNNLIASPEHQERIKSLAADIYDWLEETGGMQIPLKRTIKYRTGDHLYKKQY